MHIFSYGPFEFHFQITLTLLDPCGGMPEGDRGV